MKQNVRKHMHSIIVQLGLINRSHSYIYTQNNSAKNRRALLNKWFSTHSQATHEYAHSNDVTGNIVKDCFTHFVAALRTTINKP